MSTLTRKNPSTTKRMIVMVLLVLLLIAVIAGIKVLLVMRMMAGMKPPPPAVVSTAKTAYQEWQPNLGAVGTLRAVRGSDLALDVSGLVSAVNFHSGDDVKAGQLLLQLQDADTVAQLQQLQASAALAEVTFGRAKQQLAVQAISKADYDAAAADLKAKQAAVAQQQALVAKKQLRAPFAGHAGIVTVNPGTYLNSGTTIVTLQQLDPIYVDFYVPQKDLGALKVGQRAIVALDAYAGKAFDGRVNAINPKVDGDTRNVQVEATLPNPDHVLVPGMFARVSVDVGSEQRYLTLPQTAIVYNPYGETVYVVKHRSELRDPPGDSKAKGASAKPIASAKAANAGKSGSDLVVEQTFVTTGDKRGDQVAIVKGLESGVEVVTSGQIKLKNGSPITVDNRVQPADNPNPKPQEH